MASAIRSAFPAPQWDAQHRPFVEIVTISTPIPTKAHQIVSLIGNANLPLSE